MSARYAALLVLQMSLVVLIGFAFAAGAAEPVKEPFGTTPDGVAVERYTLKNAKGVEIGVITYGARVTHILVPDRSGTMANVTLGFDTLDGYLKDNPYFGAIVGRYGNRIAKGEVHARRQDLHARRQQRRQHTCTAGSRASTSVVWTARALTGTTGAVGRADLRQPGRRGRLSRHAHGHGDLHADRRQRAAHRLRGDDRQGDAWST